MCLAGLLGSAPGARAAASDPRAIDVAEASLHAIGGADAWEQLRYLTWNFRGRRLHHWDRGTGDVRIESGTRLVLMNIHTKQGRAWEEGTGITDPDALREALDLGYAWWVNDSYWLIMPAKLLDPGVVLRDGGRATLPDGRAADLVTVTFESVGLTPRNRYDVWIDAETHLVEQWAYYTDADDPEPKFTQPWTGWERFGDVLIATDHGGGEDWEVAAPETMPRALFERP
ncbi:hypothetical protein K8I85_12360 [bacterium]|nr:hypothetical protein [bacterium]